MLFYISSGPDRSAGDAVKAGDMNLQKCSIHIHSGPHLVWYNLHGSGMDSSPGVVGDAEDDLDSEESESSSWPILHERRDRSFHESVPTSDL
jgi:hypothetical protein